MYMLKLKHLFIVFLPLCINIFSVPSLRGFFNSKFKKVEPKKVIYSHGFGESADAGQAYTQLFEDSSYAAPEYENDRRRASFYTQESQQKLLQTWIDNIKNSGNAAIDLFIGRSMGGGTGINLLDKLIHYEQNKDFFKGTDIQSVEDADKIIDSINKGKVIFTAPALSMREATAIRMPSSFLSAATFAALTAGAYYWWSSYNKKNVSQQKEKPTNENLDQQSEKDSKEANEKQAELEKRNRIKDLLVKAGIVGLGGAAYYFFGNIGADLYSSALVNWGLPLVTRFNPSDTEPAEALKRIIKSPKYTAPTLWHFNKGDEVLYHPEEKIKKLFEGKSPSHEVIFTDDASHNTFSTQFRDKVIDFVK